jgi:hypothetical protein
VNIGGPFRSAVFTIRDGKVVRLALYGHMSEAREAVGLPE